MLEHQDNSTPVHALSSKEIFFISLTALLSLAVVFSVVYAISRLRSRRTSRKALIHSRRSSNSLETSDFSIVGCEDSEKIQEAEDIDTNYLKSESRTSMPCSIYSIPIVSPSNSEKDITSRRSHSRTTSASFALPCLLKIDAPADLTNVLSRRLQACSNSSSLDTMASSSRFPPSANGSSVTSMETINGGSAHSTDSEDEEEEYQIHRVQRAVVVRSLYLPELPPILENADEVSGHHLTVAYPRAGKDHPSSQSLAALSFGASVSVDLSDFPLPPNVM